MVERENPGNVIPIGRGRKIIEEKSGEQSTISLDLQNVPQVAFDVPATTTSEDVGKTKRQKLPMRILRHLNFFRKEFNRRHPDF